MGSNSRGAKFIFDSAQALLKAFMNAIIDTLPHHVPWVSVAEEKMVTMSVIIRIRNILNL